ncbi:ATP-grasp domain-containing protein [Schlesneria sp.]|uniref:ATP-grasp domain-containing protein n=1 Tax=Schlesneria sp. TaxID=2762018 RepID=UPI002F035FDA
MHVFVSEYLVGGACAGARVSASMRREGLAMLRAVAVDIARLPGTVVVTTLEPGLALPDPIQTIIVESAAEEAKWFARLIHDVDHVLVIAPETDGLLAERCRLVRASQAVSWNCTPEAIELCGDKLRLSHFLQALGIPTPRTHLVDFAQEPQLDAGPIVLKPLDGAGSCLTFLVRNRDEFRQAAAEYELAGQTDHCLWQPYLAGRALSMGFNISLEGRHVESLPIAEQRLSDDGRFQYRGGLIPAVLPDASREAIHELVVRVYRAIDGLAGYVGMDLVLTPEGEPILIEINPRLTTSYVGYRRVCPKLLPCDWLPHRFETSHLLKPSEETLDKLEFTPEC